MKLACWNVRGFHKPLKQRSVQTIVGNQKIDIFGILESKLDEKALQFMLRVRFRGMKAIHNFMLNNKGYILVLWNPCSVHVDVLSMCDQAIHIRVTCCRSKSIFCCSFIYGHNTIVLTRRLWENLKFFGITCLQPWILLGDFNNVVTG